MLHISDTILRKVGKHDFIQKLWKKLEDLYLLKSTPNLLFILESFFSFKMTTPQKLR